MLKQTALNNAGTAIQGMIALGIRLDAQMTVITEAFLST